MEHLGKEIEILESIYHNPHQVSRRDLAEIAGLSLGMTNVILKRLAGKGGLTIKKVNNRSIRYAVSPKGMEAITRKSYRYSKSYLPDEEEKGLRDDALRQGMPCLYC